MSEIRITDIRELPAQTIERMGLTDLMVTYLVDGRRSYTLLVPKDDATHESLKVRIQADEKSRLALMGAPFRVE